MGTKKLLRKDRRFELKNDRMAEFECLEGSNGLIGLKGFVQMVNCCS
jgi:hypothetical protein